VEAGASTRDAAHAMRDVDVGALIVLEGGDLYGIVTDRDIVVRAVAEGLDPAATVVREVCSKNPTAIESDASIDDAVSLMREHALRRLPVTQGGQPVGILAPRRPRRRARHRLRARRHQRQRP
jgi:CBS domain-containing protein